MSQPASHAAMSDLEEVLARGEGAERLRLIAAQLLGIESRLRQEATKRLPAEHYKTLDCALLAVRAATEVVSSLRPQGPPPGMNPYVDGKAFFRSTETP